MKLKIFLISLYIISFSSCLENKTEIIICSSIHGLHKSNENYTYKDLFNFIDSFKPDIIGVEIRQEDIDSSNSYLKTTILMKCIKS